MVKPNSPHPNLPISPEDFLHKTFEFLLTHIDEGIHVIDASGVTQVYNRKMAELEAMDPADVVFQPILDVFRFFADEESTLLTALRTGQGIKDVRQTYFNNRGRAITTVNDTFPIHAETGEVIGAVEIARDVTKMEQVLHSSLRTSAAFSFDGIVGKNPTFLDVLEDARRTARTMSSVLIVGETGTGKELVAQSIHQLSNRSQGPFVSQNCAALPESLIEGLLFGTVRGAFTGAIDRPGLIEQANGGTLLLDELNALSPNLQAKLLRVLQERSVRRVGATTETPIDTRIVATMNEDPVDAIAANRLRKDLYYRIGVVTLFLPPLRQRRDDIPILTAHFVEKYNQLFHLDVRGVDQQLLEKFLNYPWPGNVRELEHAIEGAMNLLTGESVIREHNLPHHMRSRLGQERDVPIARGDGSTHDASVGARGPANEGHPSDGTLAHPEESLVQGSTQGSVRTRNDRYGLHARLSDYERSYLEEVLTHHNGNISAAARELGVSRQSLQYRLRKLNLR